MAEPSGLVAYDLEPPGRLIVSEFRPLRLDDVFGPRAAARQRQAAREEAGRVAGNQASLAAARAEWGAKRERLAGNLPALAVLDLHRPEPGYESRPVCGECEADDGSGDAAPAPWRCKTFQAIAGGGS